MEDDRSTHLRRKGYRSTPSFLVTARRGIRTARAIGRRSAPDALVRAGAVTVQPVGAIRASVPVARRAAPFAVLLVVAVLVKPVRTVRASASVTC